VVRTLRTSCDYLSKKGAQKGDLLDKWILLWGLNKELGSSRTLKNGGTIHKNKTMTGGGDASQKRTLLSKSTGKG